MHDSLCTISLNSSDTSETSNLIPINANNFSIKSIQSQSHDELDLEETFTYQG